MDEISPARKRTLAKNLARATEPSLQPDDKYRPCYWSDRIYYLALNAGVPLAVIQEISWSDGAGGICQGLAYTGSMAVEADYIEKLERAAAAMIKERFGE
ncbi:MAG: hypothetical protein K2W82_15530 [Candidatus Obscuribacterales bacterium]|nr:hypothetical protein [Candidatus Obscuribacterales bacterium]